MKRFWCVTWCWMQFQLCYQYNMNMSTQYNAKETLSGLSGVRRHTIASFKLSMAFLGMCKKSECDTLNSQYPQYRCRTARPLCSRLLTFPDISGSIATFSGRERGNYHTILNDVIATDIMTIRGTTIRYIKGTWSDALWDLTLMYTSNP